MIRRLYPAILIFCAVLWAMPAFAEVLNLDIYGPGQKTVNMILLKPGATNKGPVPAQAAQLEKLLSQDLSYLPFLNLVNPASITLGEHPATGIRRDEIDFRALGLSKVDLALSTGWRQSAPGTFDLEFRLFETFNGRQLVGKAFGRVEPGQLEAVADRMAAVIMKKLTGKSGFFGSKIAYVQRFGKSKEVCVISPQGRDFFRVTTQKGVNLSPAWSWGNHLLAFTQLTRSGHRLVLWNQKTGKKKYQRFAGNTVIGPCFLPNGNLAVTLDLAGTPNIYLLDKKLKPQVALAKSWSIDVSPSFSKDGETMAFASGRMGNPHIFLLNMKDKKVSRMTYDGTYNTSPNISADGRLVVFSRQLSSGHRVFIHDLETGRERQLSFGPGDDEEPCFGPDGFFVVFSSNRSGKYQLYLTTLHGKEAKLLSTPGEAFTPAWTH